MHIFLLPLYTICTGCIKMNAHQKEKYKLLGLNIAYYRKYCELTQEQLAEKAGVDYTTISKLETALVGASLDTIFALADALEIEPVKLFDFRK